MIYVLGVLLGDEAELPQELVLPWVHHRLQHVLQIKRHSLDSFLCRYTDSAGRE
jgi:hypothetical protein